MTLSILPATSPTSLVNEIRQPKALLNTGTRRCALMVLWNPDYVERDYWQFSINVFGVNVVYFSL